MSKRSSDETSGEPQHRERRAHRDRRGHRKITHALMNTGARKQDYGKADQRQHDHHDRQPRRGDQNAPARTPLRAKLKQQRREGHAHDHSQRKGDEEHRPVHGAGG